MQESCGIVWLPVEQMSRPPRCSTPVSGEPHAAGGAEGPARGVAQNKIGSSHQSSSNGVSVHQSTAMQQCHERAANARFVADTGIGNGDG